MGAIEVRNLTKKYDGPRGDIIVLDDISLTLERGEFVALVGASGSGKSTLLHLLGGVDRPSSGDIFIGGVNIAKQSSDATARIRRRSIGLIYQFYNLIPVLNVRENITLPLELDGRSADDGRLEELLGLVGMKERELHYPNQLSGGQQQRVAIARALIASPTLILADEPTGNLDSENSREILTLLNECRARYGATLLLVTHDEKAAAGADRVLSISGGRLAGGGAGT